MWLTPKNNIVIFIWYILFLFASLQAYGLNKEVKKNKDVDGRSLLFKAKDHYENRDYDLSIKTYQEALESHPADSVYIFKELSFSYAKVNKPELSCKFIEKYIKASLDVAFVGHSSFEVINDSEEYISLSNKYLKKVWWWPMLCFYVGFIGVFIAIVLNLRKDSDKIANFLMSTFVLQHSFFILHISVLLSNYEYYLPHTLYMSTSFSFLYGPLIYFYFKRVTTKYEFKVSDLWHLLPTLLIVILIFPIYMMSGEEKLRMMLNNDWPYLSLISICKLISLIVYGVLVIQMFLRSNKHKNLISSIQYIWQRNIVVFCSIYIISYAIYSVLIIQYIISGFLFNLQVASMASLVLYVSFTAFVQPGIFGELKLIKNEATSNKYEKSGLTRSLSLELKEKLLYLLDHEKIYKQNDISLYKISELLDTTRHNASQIINEHFDLNFFELINKYRIEEAMKILRNNSNEYYTMIDVAYEVGFNNKVTFNKSFKKYNQITPSEYVKSLVA